MDTSTVTRYEIVKTRANGTLFATTRLDDSATLDIALEQKRAALAYWPTLTVDLVEVTEVTTITRRTVQ
jgi:hypothetical protein